MVPPLITPFMSQQLLVCVDVDVMPRWWLLLVLCRSWHWFTFPLWIDNGWWWWCNFFGDNCYRDNQYIKKTHTQTQSIFIKIQYPIQNHISSLQSININGWDFHHRLSKSVFYNYHKSIELRFNLPKTSPAECLCVDIPLQFQSNWFTIFPVR